MTSFDLVWKRIRAHTGEKFHTIRGIEFTYIMEQDRLCPSRTIYWIAKNDFRKAYRMAPVDGPSVICNDVRGPSYVWAILHDKRIAESKWK